MKLEILSPEKTLFRGDTDSVRLPGVVGSFTVWPHHAPLISALAPGEIRYRNADKEEKLDIQGGFAEIRDDTITVCIESNE
ncbi:ATP synthase F1 subunit epsilon [Gallalistipes aquisgranensis]|uniref:ATP synthase F1 subunit epsilon n=1 Tax=Gallalistipes aquisgranensis TaxID=2779358 RepID=UPI001CF8478A|nr:ATP synthase F1 subunit epsilon [Gallalistipes aquisgranensis]MBE5032996.1 ATP synthase F1 subunit epsilon [Gallalistipes aquisgranensis]